MLFYYKEILSHSDYYPFGWGMPGRSESALGHRYGFNGKELDNEVKGGGVQYDYGFRIYDSRVARFLSVDPLTKSYPMLTPYQFASNRPIDGIDLDGLEYLDANESLLDVTTGRVRLKLQNFGGSTRNKYYLKYSIPQLNLSWPTSYGDRPHALDRFIFGSEVDQAAYNDAVNTRSNQPPARILNPSPSGNTRKLNPIFFVTAANFVLEQAVNFTDASEKETLKSHDSKFRFAFADMKFALSKGEEYIPKKHWNLMDLSTITNYILQGPNWLVMDEGGGIYTSSSMPIQRDLNKIAMRIASEISNNGGGTVDIINKVFIENEEGVTTRSATEGDSNYDFLSNEPNSRKSTIYKRKGN